MALRTRTKFLSPQEQQVLLEVEQGNPGFLDYVNQTGQLPPEYVNQIQGIIAQNVTPQSTASAQAHLTQLQSILSKPREEVLKSFIERTKDEASLNDEDLRNRLEAFQELNPSEAQLKTTLDKEKVKKAVEGRYATFLAGTKRFGITEDEKNKLINDVADYILKNNGIPENLTSEQVLGRKVSLGEPLVGLEHAKVNLFSPKSARVINTTLQSGDLYSDKPQIRNEDIKRVQEALSAREQAALAQGQVEDFLTSLPENLKASREEFLRSQTQQGQDFLTDVAAPSVVEELNARNPLLVRGSQIPGLIAQESELVAQKLQELSNHMSAEDFDFYSNSAYRNTIRKLAEATTDVRSQLDFERAQSRTEQENRFVSNQNQLTRDLNLDLFRRQQQRNLEFQNRRLQSQQDAMKKQEALSLAIAGGKAVGEVATGVALNKFG